MRLLSLLALLAVSSSCKAASASLNPDTTSITTIDGATLSHSVATGPGKRFLRRVYDNELDDFDNDSELEETHFEEEERGVADDAFEKLVMMAVPSSSRLQNIDDAAQKVAPMTGKLPSKLLTAEIRAQHLKSVEEKFPKGLSSPTMKQLVDVEFQRADDIANNLHISKSKNMKRNMGHLDESEIAPIKESVKGRDYQLYTADTDGVVRREVAVILATRSDGNVLLISSSSPAKNEFLLPKGGWDHTDDFIGAAKREILEEGGIDAVPSYFMGRTAVSEGKSNYFYNAVAMEQTHRYVQWPESMRYRIWVPYDDAIKLLADNRPAMADLVKQAKQNSALKPKDRIVNGKEPTLLAGNPPTVVA